MAPSSSLGRVVTATKEGEKCELCGKPATRFLFASFVCDDEECVEKARRRRGGPGGHQNRKLPPGCKLTADD